MKEEEEGGEEEEDTQKSAQTVTFLKKNIKYGDILPGLHTQRTAQTCFVTGGIPSSHQS